MTCIIGFINDGDMYIGCDSQATGDDYKLTTSYPKVFKKCNMLIGYSGSSRVGQIIQYQLNFPDHKEEYDDMTYIISFFIPCLRKILEENGFLSKNNGHDEFEGTIIILYRSKIFKIESNFNVFIPESNFICAGSGMIAASASMIAMGLKNTLFESEYAIRQSLEIAGSLDCYVSAPYIILKQD